jgi:uncharacterized protein YdaU (DUF1376 family)
MTNTGRRRGKMASENKRATVGAETPQNGPDQLHSGGVNVADVTSYHALPYYQYYPAAFDLSTATFTLAEIGAYQRLLNHQWANGSVPGDNVKALSQICRCTYSTMKSVWKTIGEKFTRGDDGKWRNRKMERVRAEATSYREQQSNRGRASAAARANQKPTSVEPALEPPLQPQGNSLSVSSSSDIDQSKEHSDLAKPHPIRDLLGFHETTFVARYGVKPAPYTGKDAKHAADLLKAHGDIRARRLVEAFFASSDPFVAKSGHGMGMLMAVQNKIIAEMSGTTPKGDGLDGLREFARG